MIEEFIRLIHSMPHADRIDLTELILKIDEFKGFEEESYLIDKAIREILEQKPITSRILFT